jgi:hypothetical protein
MANGIEIEDCQEESEGLSKVASTLGHGSIAAVYYQAAASYAIAAAINRLAEAVENNGF